MAPEQGPEFKNASCGKTPKPTNELESGPEQSDETQTTSLPSDSMEWIYLIGKNRLLEISRQYMIDITESSTIGQLRAQLKELICLMRQHEATKNFLRPLEEEITSEENKTITKCGYISDNSSSNLREDLLYRNEIMTVIRRWDLSYDGGDNLMDFIRRFEELTEAYEIDRNLLLFSLPEILKKRALQWYRIRRNNIRTWDRFKEEAKRFFQPKRYLRQLEEKIYSRKQGPHEKSKDYILSLQTLISQHPTLASIDHTNRIYEGLRLDYKLYIRRPDFKSLEELMDLTEEYECIRNDEAKERRCQPMLSHQYTNGIFVAGDVNNPVI